MRGITFSASELFIAGGLACLLNTMNMIVSYFFVLVKFFSEFVFAFSNFGFNLFILFDHNSFFLVSGGECLLQKIDSFDLNLIHLVFFVCLHCLKL